MKEAIGTEGRNAERGRKGAEKGREENELSKKPITVRNIIPNDCYVLSFI